MQQLGERLFGTVAAQVEGGIEGFALLVDVVVDGLEAVVALLRLVDGDDLLARLLQTVGGDGHTQAVAFDDGLLALEFDELAEGVAAIDADDVAHLQGPVGGPEVVVGLVLRCGLTLLRCGAVFSALLASLAVVFLLLLFYLFGILAHLLAGLLRALALGVGLLDVGDGALDGAVGVGQYLAGLLACVA